MPIRAFDRVTCDSDNCDASFEFDREAGSKYAPNEERLLDHGFHEVVATDEYDVGYYEYYCHSCWLVRTTKRLAVRLQELQAEMDGLSRGE